MSNSFVFTRDPTITFPPAEIARLAGVHRIEPTLLEAIIAEAATFYGIAQWSKAQGYDDPDTLHKIEKPATALLKLLANEVNRHRLFVKLLGIEDGYAPGDLVAIGDKFAQLLPFLEDIRSAARKAHRTGPKHRPKAKGDLAEAYRALNRHWRSIFGDDDFTNGWDNVGQERPLIPTGPAACFLYDVMKLIDPTRERLGAELRDLMTDTVASLPGPRRGRRNLG